MEEYLNIIKKASPLEPIFNLVRLSPDIEGRSLEKLDGKLAVKFQSIFEYKLEKEPISQPGISELGQLIIDS